MFNLNRDSVLSEVQRLLNKQPFSKEDKSRADSLLALADSLTPGSTELRKWKLAQDALAIGLDPALSPRQQAQFRMLEGVRESNQVFQDFQSALRFGIEHVSPERRALAVGTGGAGGYLVPAAFSEILFSTLKGYDPLFDGNVVNLLETASGTQVPVPVIDDGTGAASVVAENALNAEADVTFAQAMIPNADKWTCPQVRVSRELVEDGAFPLSEVLANAFAVRFARGVGAALVTNLLGAASQGTQCPTGNTTTIPYDSLVDLISSIDPAYLANQKTAFLMRFATLVALFKLKSSTGGAPMLPITFEGGRFSLWGRPIYLSPSMPALGASNKTVLFGDMSKFTVRTVRDSVRILPQFERYAEYGQVGYSASMRVSAVLVKAPSADSPVKYLTQSAS